MRSLRRFVGRRMLVQIGEHTLDGTVTEVDKETVTLHQTSLLSTTGADSLRMDGDVVIPSSVITWAQVV